jgi:hypothetical protein
LRQAYNGIVRSPLLEVTLNLFNVAHAAVNSKDEHGSLPELILIRYVVELAGKVTHGEYTYNQIEECDADMNPNYWRPRRRRIHIEFLLVLQTSMYVRMEGF